jgi:hypothetical protein
VSIPAGIMGLAFVLVFLLIMLIYAAAGRARPSRHFREIPAFDRLRRSIGLAVEAGMRLHVSLGRGILTGPQSAVAFVGLSMLERIARATGISDQPPVATTGESSLAILAQDTLRGAAQFSGAEFDPTSAMVAGLTPFSYATGTMVVVHDEGVGANILVGSFGSEAALIAEASDRADSLTLAGTDLITGQAILYATAEEPLIGEEVFAGGAYLGVGPLHTASLRAQDLLRILIILVILVGVLLRLLGIRL